MDGNDMHDKGVVGDVAAVLITVGALANYLPALAALASIIWTGMRIWDWCMRKWKR